jgi:hypothetical protein
MLLLFYIWLEQETILYVQLAYILESFMPMFLRCRLGDKALGEAGRMSCLACGQYGIRLGVAEAGKGVEVTPSQGWRTSCGCVREGKSDSRRETVLEAGDFPLVCLPGLARTPER